MSTNIKKRAIATTELLAPFDETAFKQTVFDIILVVYCRQQIGYLLVNEENLIIIIVLDWISIVFGQNDVFGG
jgi:hypothetical protein